jgi:hypothetical protein
MNWHSRALALLGLLGATGCDRVFPYQSAEGSTDRASDRHAGDRPDWRGGGRTDRGSDAPSDHGLRDSCPPLDQPAITTGCRLIPCLECEPVTSAAIAACGVQPCCHGDCDALPDLRDPWPGTCNTLVFSDDFCDPTLSKWTFTSTTSVESPGQLSISALGQHTVWAGTTLPPRGGLVEARLDGSSGSQLWELAISADGDTPQTLPAGTFRMCILIFNVAKGVLSLRNEVKTAPAGLLQSDERVLLAFSDSNVVLQSWLEGNTHRCRAVIAGLPHPSVDLGFTGALPAANHAVSVGVMNQIGMGTLNATVDWVRVLAP